MQHLNHEKDKLVAANRLRPLFGPESSSRGTPAAGADLFTFVTAKFGGEGFRPLTTYYAPSASFPRSEAATPTSAQRTATATAGSSGRVAYPPKAKAEKIRH